MSGNRYNIQSRYKTSASTASGVQFGNTGPSALSLYTNKNSSKSSSSGYTSDHYSSPSTLHSLSGYISDIGGGSHVSKPSYLQTNTYGSSPGVKSYSSYPYTNTTMSRNLSTNSSRMQSINYSSYSSGYARNISPNPPKYVSYSRSSSQNTCSNYQFDSNNNTNNSKSKEMANNKAPNKAPADFTSDSEDDNELDMRSHTNMIFTSRSTSPNRETSNLRVDSISTTQQIIRPKKVVFGVPVKKTSKQTQVNENDFKEHLSPARSPCRSLTPTYNTPNITPTLTPTHSPSHSPSPVRMRYGCTPNRRSNNGSNFNRYSMPIITTTCATEYSNYDSLSNRSEHSISPQPLPHQPLPHQSLQPSPLPSNDAKTYETMKTINESNCLQTNDNIKYNDSNNNHLGSDSKSSVQSRSNRMSPSVVNRRRSKSRSKLTGRSRSRSKEKILDREESSTTLTTSSDDEDDRQKSSSDRHSRTRKKRETNCIETNSMNKMQFKGSLESINELKSIQNDCNELRSASAEPINGMNGNTSHKRSNGSNESSSSPEKVIIRRPSVKPTKVESIVVVTRLPMKVKDPYSTASECECDDNEFVDANDGYSSSVPLVTIRLSPDLRLSSPQTVVQSYKAPTDTSSESSDNSSKSCHSVRLNDNKIQKSSTVIEVNKEEAKDLTQNFINTSNSEEKEISKTFSDNQISILSNFESVESLQEKGTTVLPFPKEDNEITFKNIDSKDVSLRDSGFSESSARPDSPYDNIKSNDISYENICKNSQNMSSNDNNITEKQFVNKVDDIDSLLTGHKEQTFEELERKFQIENKLPVQYFKDEARKNLSLFISKCQDIDEMIGPTSPISPNHFSNINSSTFCKLFEKIEEEDDSVAIDVSDVKVHNAKAMKSTVEAYTEEIDSSAVRIRENKALSVHLSKISEDIEEDFNQNIINRKYAKNTKVREIQFSN